MMGERMRINITIEVEDEEVKNLVMRLLGDLAFMLKGSSDK